MNKPKMLNRCMYKKQVEHHNHYEVSVCYKMIKLHACLSMKLVSEKVNLKI